MLLLTVAIGALLAPSRTARNSGNRSPWRTAIAVALVLMLGFALPRAPHVTARRADVPAAQAEAARAARRFGSAAQLYRQALELRPTEIAYLIGLASVQTDWAAEAPDNLRDRGFRRASMQLRRALRLEQATATEHANLARLYTLWEERQSEPSTRTARLGRADGYYRAALGLRPQSARYYAEWGRLSVLQGRLDPARWRFGRSLELDPTQGQTYLWVRPLLASDLLEKPDALAELGATVGAISAAQVHAALVEHFIEAGLFETAIEAAYRLAAVIPNQPLGHWTLAGLYSRTGQHAEGLPHARRAFELARGRDRAQIARLIENLEAAVDSSAS